MFSERMARQEALAAVVEQLFHCNFPKFMHSMHSRFMLSVSTISGCFSL